MENKTEENKYIEPAHESSRAMLTVFGQGSHFAFLYKRTEKLVAAIYLITDFIKDSEPLKGHIREKALELLSLNLKFTTVSLSERKTLLKKYQSISLEIISLTGIAHMSSMISEMNYSVLKREFEKLANIVERDESKKANEETIILNPGFFEKASDPLYETSSKGHQEMSKNETPKKNEMASDHTSQSRHSEEVKSDRKAIITKMLSKKSGLGIKDFSQAIKGCSEKTIQRELLAMVAAGILRKEGERRWSTYSLAK